LFCVVNQTTFRQLLNGRFPPNLVTKRSSVSRRGIRTNIFENFYFRGHLPKKFEKFEMHCREILFTPRCSPRDRVSEVGQLFSMTYGCGATVRDRKFRPYVKPYVKFARFSGFALFFPYKTLKDHMQGFCVI